MSNYLIRNATVIAVDATHGTEPFSTSIRIADGLISEMAVGLEARPGEQIINGADSLIIPGMVNAHAHNWENLWRGTQDNMPLEVWMLMCYPVVGSDPLSPELVRLRTLLMAAESLKSGVTTVVDDAYEIPFQKMEHLAAEFAAYEQAGIRANLSGQIADKPFLDTMPFAREFLSSAAQKIAGELEVTSAADYLAFAREAISKFDRTAEHGRLRFMVGPSAPQRCTPELLTGCSALAKEFDLELHTHVLETRTQRVTSDEFYNGSFVEWFDELGVLSPHVTLAHGVWLNEKELGLLAENGCSISHNPLSNMKLASGLMPWSEVRRAGVNVAIGTDGVCSSDTQRVSEVMKATALVHKLTSDNPEDWPTAGQVLEAATINGARSAQLGSTVGSLEVGKEADLVIYDLNTLAFSPRQQVDLQLVYSENGSSIRTVMVAGRIIVDEGELVTIDESQLLQDVREITPWLHEWQSKAMAENEIFVEGFWKQYRKSMKMFSGQERYRTRDWSRRATS
ncbi:MULTISPECIES: amidohydrolase family protein [Corynebacterium]|uniref:Cytosine deaminase and related metal-dependent hydrolases n=1 Tax=Corynebacterium variabile TaxID=1727 RepID=A0A120N515_9CORY|nr:amidohydrolase [Corynebacterium variabile]MDN5704703.1 amidohydrolase [Yaniella sp.]MDN6299754.1 amidohydrolase [Micrococcaceae bacterium]MDN6520699.1 amidohydrolase [Yaniella sp.]CUU67582.1 Cytosine deaminase and related metal-dependent hydrolases [Corynebacterium variabile]GEC87645.1 N-ethylammeline chlorohydrolase [Corynebacterium variabile]